MRLRGSAHEKHTDSETVSAPAAQPTTPARVRTAALPDARAEAADRRLADVLVESGRLSPEHVTELMSDRREPGDLAPVVFNSRAVEPYGLAALIAQIHNLAMVDLRTTAPDASLRPQIPEDAARRYHALPYTQTDTDAWFVVDNPARPGAVEYLGGIVGRPVHLAVAPFDDVDQALNLAYDSLAGIDADINTIVGRAGQASNGDSASGAARNEAVARILGKVLTQAVRDRASDVHLEPFQDHFRVRFRVDGVLRDIVSLPRIVEPSLVAQLKTFAALDAEPRSAGQSGQFSADVDGNAVDHRLSITPTVHGEKVAIRILNKSRTPLHRDELGMVAEIDDAYRQVTDSPRGMLIAAGPTGSGKTTTLYATVAEMSSANLNVMTIEDPVEYLLPSANQLQVNTEAGLTFEQGLRTILRQDPDVILLGEIRDAETARTSVQAALGGQLVLTSLHSNDAAAAVHRLFQMDIDPHIVAFSVAGIVGQRLVRRICASCRTTYQAGRAELSLLEAFGVRSDGTLIYGQGCNVCSHTGYRGRIGVFELLTVTDEMRELISAGGSYTEIRSLAQQQGMRPLAADGMRLVGDGVTTITEVAHHMPLL